MKPESLSLRRGTTIVLVAVALAAGGCRESAAGRAREGAADAAAERVPVAGKPVPIGVLPPGSQLDLASGETDGWLPDSSNRTLAARSVAIVRGRVGKTVSHGSPDIVGGPSFLGMYSESLHIDEVLASADPELKAGADVWFRFVGPSQDAMSGDPSERLILGVSGLGSLNPDVEYVLFLEPPTGLALPHFNPPLPADAYPIAGGPAGVWEVNGTTLARPKYPIIGELDGFRADAEQERRLRQSAHIPRIIPWAMRPIEIGELKEQVQDVIGTSRPG